MDSQEFLNSHSAVRRSESGSTEVRKERSETKKESMNKGLRQESVRREAKRLCEGALD